MIQIGTYSIQELEELLGTKGKQTTDRKLTRLEITFTSTGRGNARMYHISAIQNHFKVYCVLKLHIPAQADLLKIRNLYYYFFCVEGFQKLPLIEMAKVMEREGVHNSRQSISRWISHLQTLNYIEFDNADCIYYAISRDENNEHIYTEITKEEYNRAWRSYFENRDKEGCQSAYSRMYSMLGGHPYKKPIYRMNAIEMENINELIVAITDTLPT